MYFCYSFKRIVPHFLKCTHLDCYECHRINVLLWEHVKKCKNSGECRIPGCRSVTRVIGWDRHMAGESQLRSHALHSRAHLHWQLRDLCSFKSWRDPQIMTSCQLTTALHCNSDFQLKSQITSALMTTTNRKTTHNLQMTLITEQFTHFFFLKIQLKS